MTKVMIDECTKLCENITGMRHRKKTAAGGGRMYIICEENHTY